MRIKTNNKQNSLVRFALVRTHHLFTMVGYKRKRDELEDSDDEEPSFGKQTLPVADLPDDFDTPPADGMQYLFTVRCAPLNVC